MEGIHRQGATDAKKDTTKMIPDSPSDRQGSPQPQRHGGNHTHALERIHEALQELRFGEITVVVQDGYVVQVERTEKLRLQR